MDSLKVVPSSPIIFNIIIKQILAVLETTWIGVNVNGTIVYGASNADDCWIAGNSWTQL